MELYAIPAYPHPVKIVQPNGTTITLVGHGDEHCNYVTTTDGYTLLKNEQGIYCYAMKQDGHLVVSEYSASDVSFREEKELQMLARLPKHLRQEQPQGVRQVRCFSPATSQEERFATLSRAMEAQRKYRGLVILVNFNDCRFRMADSEIKEIYQNMMSQRNFTGYYDTAKNPSFQPCTGSVRDYFYDNSNGLFDPEFDVVGPITINHSKFEMEGFENSWTIARDVIRAVDSKVDFSRYDSDNDGEVDMFYIVYAGYASSYTGNDERLVWPHASNMYGWYYNVKADGMNLGRYACSTELYGWSSHGDNDLNGIGTICHEFSHVLGYSDHYDTDYGDHNHPGEWDVMSGGSYMGMYGRTPVGYNAYERMVGGFLKPVLITEPGDFSMIPLNEDAATAYRLNTRQRGSDGLCSEFFLFENRQRSRWDAELPSHGMLVWRVDSTDVSLWEENKVNATERLGFQLVRAMGGSSASARDPFPGTGKVSRLTNNTKPANLLSYKNYKSSLIVDGITETNGIIHFSVEKDAVNEYKRPADALFYETFFKSDGIGGGDEDFVGPSTGGLFVPDNEGWSTKDAYAGFQCGIYGSGLSAGTAETPVLNFSEEEAVYELNVMLAPVNKESTKVTLTVSSGSAKLLDENGQAVSSIVYAYTSTSNWTDCRAFVLAKGDFKLKFKANKRRFFIDEVIITASDMTGIEELTTTVEPMPLYNLQGQRVQECHGLVLSKDHKSVIR